MRKPLKMGLDSVLTYPDLCSGFNLPYPTVVRPAPHLMRPDPCWLARLVAGASQTPCFVLHRCSG